MGMFDQVRCRYPLPGVGVLDAEFQTKDTPAQFCEDYEIREDGTLWRQHYEIVDRSDPTDPDPLKRAFGSMARENGQWEREFLSGAMRFYTKEGDEWLEFEALFLNGALQDVIRVTEKESERLQGCLRFDAGTMDRLTGIARAQEREACAQLVVARADEAEADGDTALGLTLLTLALRIRRNHAEGI